MPESLAIYAPILPEMILAIGAMALLMYGVFRPETQDEAVTVGWMAIALLAVAGGVMLYYGEGSQSLFEGSFVNDDFARFMKVLALGGSAFALMLAFDDFRDLKIMKFEYPVLVLLATTGMMVMISARDLIALYIGLELQSLALYVVAAYRRDSLRASEAGLKYFVLGALSSGMLLYGASLLYGFSGSTDFQVIANAAKGAEVATNLWLIFGLVFLMVGLAFKISAVPFHMWTPDVYEGSATPVTAFFATAPKVAAMALLVRVTLDAFPGIAVKWQQIITFVAIASMLLGAFAAIGQNNIKRLMAYSSIANIGFALVGLAANSVEGTQGVIIYMAIYVVMTLGTFACILSMRRNEVAVEEISELSGLARTNLPMAFALMILMFSLAGIPPLVGFFAKYYVFLAAINAGLYPLAVVGVVASVVGAYYYLRVIKVMFFDEADEPFQPVRFAPGLVMGISAILMVVGVVGLGPFVDAAMAAAQTFRF
ncbi:MAG: NADH-quinone oxidoreductase subunit NuoN [Hyphomicrobiaceae bacterium TMED74]|nr:NADH-quinone oxidoreductase subunit NuoN [Filomicrobium sp.]RPG45601.1 MAG: NADH-quinone oxidoreductase subunit NuoN [Hyphomicrobiaceae bacterium TMED74]